MSPCLPGSYPKFVIRFPFASIGLVLLIDENPEYFLTSILMPLVQSNRPRILLHTACLNCVSEKFPVCAWPVMMRRAESATAVSRAWLAKKTTAVSMMANISARNGAATMPNSTAAIPSLPRAKRRIVLKRSNRAGIRCLVRWERPARIAWIITLLSGCVRCAARTDRQAIRLSGLMLSKITLSKCCCDRLQEPQPRSHFANHAGKKPRDAQRLGPLAPAAVDWLLRASAWPEAVVK